MPKSLLYSYILFSFLFVCQLKAQTATKQTLVRGVFYKSNVALPLSNEEKVLLKEVFADQFEELVIKNPQRLKHLKDLLRNRIEVKRISNFPKRTKLLSEVSLFNKYNAKLRRKRFKKETFNPLKYQFDFFANSNEIYRVDKTDYYIIIKSQFQK